MRRERRLRRLVVQAVGFPPFRKERERMGTLSAHTYPQNIQLFLYILVEIFYYY